MTSSSREIPDTGKHHGGEPDRRVTSSVRAPDPPEVEYQSSPPSSPKFQLTRHEEHGYYQLHAFSTESRDLEERFEEVGQYSSSRDLKAALEEIPGENRFVVFENSETGDVFFDREQDISGDWTGQGQFNSVAIFEREEDAARYADERQKAS